MNKTKIIPAIISARVTVFFAASGIIISLAVFAGWLNEWMFLTRVTADEVPMAPSTAFTFIILNLGLWFYIRYRALQTSRNLTLPAVIIVIGLSGLLFLLRLLGYCPAWEHFFIKLPDHIFRFQLAHMSIVTAGLFLISGFAMLFLQSRRKLFNNLGFIFTLVILAFSLLILLAYGFNAPFFYTGSMIPPASLTAFSFLLASSGFLSASDKNIFLIKKIMSDSTSAKLLRIFLPITITLTVIESLIIVRILPLINIHPAIGISLVTLIFVIAVGVIVPAISRKIGKALDAATENLRISEEKFSKAFQNAPLMLALISIEDGTMFEVNEQFSVLTGYARTEVIGKKITDLGVLTPDDRMRLIGELKQNGKIYDLDIAVYSNDKKIHHCLFNGELIKVDGRDLLLALVLDITERKQAEQELAFRNILLSTQQETSLDGILVVSENNTIISYNRRFIEIMGIPRELIENKSDEPVLRFVTEQVTDPRQFLRRIQYLYENRHETSHEELMLKDGRILDRYSSPMFGPDDRYYGRVWYFRDITVRKRSEEALRTSKQIIEGIINAIPVSVFWKDNNLVYLGCNAIFARDAGFADPKDIIGKDDYQMKWRDHAELYRNDDRQVIESGLPKLLIEEPMTTPDGNISLLTNKIPLLDYDGKISGVLGTYINITERKQAEEKLKRNYDTQKTLNLILALSLENITLDELLLHTLDLLFDLNSFSFEKKGAIFLAGDAPGSLVMRVQRALPAVLQKTCSEVPFGKCLCGRAASTKRIVFASGINEQHDVHFEGMTPHGHYCVPIMSAEQVLGVINVYVRDGYENNKEDEDFLTAIANTLAGVIKRKQAEEALRESETHFRTLADSGQALIWTSGVDKKCSYFNLPWLNFTGRTLEQELGDGWTEGVHPDDLQQCFEIYAGAFDRREKFSMEYRLRHAGGEYRWIQDNGTPRYNSNGEFIGYIGHCLDINERKLADVRILQANRVYAVISQINQTIVRLKNKDELFREVCRIAVEFGKLRMAWVGLIDKETSFVKPAAFAGFEDGYLTAIKSISISDTPEGRGPTGAAVRTGRFFFCEDIETDPRMALWREEALKRGYRSSISLPLKMFGECIGAFTLYSVLPRFFDQEEIELLGEVANDLSFALESIETGKKHKLAEDSLQEVTERLRFALDGTNDGIWDVQMETGEMYLSPRGKEILGYGQNETLPANTWNELVYPDDLQRTQADLNAYFEGRTPLFSTEQRLKTKDGGWKWILTRGKAVAWNSAGKPSRMTGTHTDITERKRGEEELIRAKEKAEENNRLKSAFLRNMSHELRTPMNAIMGFSGLMQDAEADEKNYFAGIIQKSSEQLLMVIDDVILLSRLQSEKLPVNNTEFKPAGLVTDVYQMFNLPKLKKELDLTVNIPAQYKNMVIRSDADKIKQILINLASNAVKYTLKGGVEIGFDMQNGNIEFYVKDTGIGIPEREQKRIFEPFYRGEKVISAAIGGTGLGLNIARELIELLDGKIGVNSVPDQGSRFYFTIPVEKSDKPHSEQVLPEPVQRDWKDFTVLIAEDEPDNYLYLEFLLRGKVKRIDHAINGLKAVELSSKNRYNLVLMDLKMPIMDGIEATQKIKRQFPDIPVIAQTAYATPEEREKAMQAGCDDYIAKPIKKADLMAMINKVFS